jgi:hypothetical protein
VLLVPLALAACSSGSDTSSESAKKGPSVIAPENNDPDAGGPASPSVSPNANVRKLLTNPTPELLAAARADHAPTQQEIALIALYWALIVDAEQQGGFDPAIFQTSLIGYIQGLAVEYPTFFASDKTGYHLLSISSPRDFACDKDCQPSFSNMSATLTDLGITLGNEGAKALFPKASVIIDAAVNVFVKNGVNGNNVISDVADAILDKGDPSAFLLDMAQLTLSAAALVAVGPEATAVMVVAGVASVVQGAFELSKSSALADQCTKWKSASCCDTVPCDQSMGETCQDCGGTKACVPPGKQCLVCGDKTFVNDIGDTCCNEAAHVICSASEKCCGTSCYTGDGECYNSSWCEKPKFFHVCDDGTQKCLDPTACCADSACEPSNSFSSYACDESKNACVGCVTSADCRRNYVNGDELVACDTGTQKCVECMTDDDCTFSQWGRRCVNKKCEVCTINSDCKSDIAPVCASVSGDYCCTACLSDQDCAAQTGYGPVQVCRQKPGDPCGNYCE